MRFIGIIEILLSGLCFGFLGIFGKTAYEQGVTSGEFLGFRFLFSSGILFFYFLFFRRKMFLLPGQKILQCLCLGVFGYAVFSSCFFRALHGLSASFTVLLLYLYPIFVLCGEKIFFGEKLSALKISAIPLQFFGLAVLIGVDFSTLDIVSLLYGLGAAFFYALYILASSKFLKNISSWSSTFYIQLGAAAVLSGVYLQNFSHDKEIILHSYKILLATAIIGSLMAMSFFLSGLQKLKSYEASILSTAEPITGILLAVIFLGEHFRGLQILGALMILGAMLLVAISNRTHARQGR